MKINYEAIYIEAKNHAWSKVVDNQYTKENKINIYVYIKLNTKFAKWLASYTKKAHGCFIKLDIQYSPKRIYAEALVETFNKYGIVALIKEERRDLLYLITSCLF